MNSEENVVVMDMRTCSYGYVDLVGDDGTVYWKIKIKSRSVGIVATTSNTYDYVAIYRCNCTTGARRLSQRYYNRGHTYCNRKILLC